MGRGQQEGRGEQGAGGGKGAGGLIEVGEGGRGVS